MAVYVCSDIHGLQERYEKMISHIRDDDHLYVLGDVIDRGPAGISILLDLLSRPNVTVMLGNHEYMMLCYYRALQGYNKNEEEKTAALINWRFNHCEATMKEFEALDANQQKKLLDTLETLPIAICDLHIEDTCFYLVHGCPSTILREGIHDLISVKAAGILVEYLLWNRMDPIESYYTDRCVITGHTPTLFYQDVHPYAIWIQGNDIHTTHLIDIDCGCAIASNDSRIALVCLHDFKVNYY